MKLISPVAMELRELPPEEGDTFIRREKAALVARFSLDHEEAHLLLHANCEIVVRIPTGALLPDVRIVRAQ